MPAERLSPLAVKILARVWRDNAIGDRSIAESKVKEELSVAQDEWVSETQILQNGGFLTILKGSETSLSLTPLGLAILRQIEEDNLQELR